MMTSTFSDEQQQKRPKRIRKSRSRLDENGDNFRDFRWHRKYHELVEYYNKNGDCLVPRSHSDKALYNWVLYQRQEFKKWMHGKLSSMSNERKTALEKIGFVWKMKTKLPKPVDWDFRFQELSDYCEKYGNTLVPQKYKTNVQLGRWVETQRRQYKLMEEGKASNLTSERIDKLDSVGFVWSLRDQYETAFSSKVDKLRSFVSENGHCNPDHKEHRDLCRWIIEQRRQYKNWREGKQSSMTESRCQLLEELGLNWSSRPISEKEKAGDQVEKPSCNSR